MSDKQPKEETTRIEQAVVKRKKGISPVWILPIIAALIGGWLLYKGIAEAPIEVVINFDTGEGITAGKTKVIFKGLNAGVVQSLKMNPDLKSVDVTVDFDQRAKPILLNNTEFWLVKPRLSLTEVSGLGTVLKGNHIAMRVSDWGDKPARRFKALDEPPPVSEDAPGLHLTLVSRKLSVGYGSPVNYKGIEVGDVQSYKLSEDKQEVQTKIFIQPQYSHLVNEKTRFWNAGGISVSGGLSGLKIRTESLEAILTGGLAFYTPEGEPNATAVQNGNIFKLFDDYESAHQTGVPIKITFDSAEGLDKDTEIKYHGITVGKVDSVTFGPSLKKVTLSAHLDQSAGAMTSEGTQFWVVKPEFGLSKVSHLGTLITGAYIAVQPAMKKGKPKNEFIGQRKPSAEKPAEWGLNIILTADQLGSIKVGDKVYYREIVVGEVSSYELADTADHVRIYLNIQKRYTLLVRENSVFWNSSGIGVDFGLFSGLKIQTESLESMMSGGVAFATQDNEDMGEQVNENAVFPLHAKMDEDWLKWKPRIELTQ
jgi:paraquat-inducible protein B